MTTIAPGSSPIMRSMASRYRWRRPRVYYPQFEAVCALWDHFPLLAERVLARNSLAYGNMTTYDAEHFRQCFKRVANRYGLFAGLQYATEIRGRELIVITLGHDRGCPSISQTEAMACLRQHPQPARKEDRG